MVRGSACGLASPDQVRGDHGFRFGRRSANIATSGRPPLAPCRPVDQRPEPMARDYYSIVANAVAGLKRNTEADRRAVYDRARAMLRQLQQKAALSPSQLQRESAALE